jgi:RNA polymerase sigma-70 factor, ECF subfamily
MPNVTDAHDALSRAFAEERGRLWTLCYRLTGSAPDADDLVQETFERALRHPPADLTRPIAPWLTTVATRLGVDRLRHRKSLAYVGPWLPTPIEAEANGPHLTETGPSPAARYGALESVSFAFLVALEALTPKQRAVLVLRDVLDCSGAETAETLEITEADVKVSLHRARGRLESYDRDRVPPTAELRAATLAALTRFLTALMNDDWEGMAAAVRDDVRLVNDAGGEFHAARKPVVGRDKVITFHRKIRRDGVPFAWRPAVLNGLPGVLFTYAPSDPKLATRAVLLATLDREGRIRELDGILATPKIGHLDFPVVRLEAPG